MLDNIGSIIKEKVTFYFKDVSLNPLSALIEIKTFQKGVSIKNMRKRHVNLKERLFSTCFM